MPRLKPGSGYHHIPRPDPEATADATPEQPKPKPRKRTPEEIATSIRRTDARHALLYTPALGEMDRIENHHIFDGFPPSDVHWVHTGPEADAARSHLHDRYRELCDQRQRELAEKFGTWPLAEGTIDKLLRERLRENTSC